MVSPVGETSSPLYLVFDVESVGLHGEGFAVGYVVVDDAGTEYGSRLYACPSTKATGTMDGRHWVAEHVPVLDTKFNNPVAIRTRFWTDWVYWKEQGALLVADYAWPVETNFLSACVADDPGSRTWQGPYPLHEVASFMVVQGLDPDQGLPRNAEHHPLEDARHSARRLLLALTP